MGKPRDEYYDAVQVWEGDVSVNGKLIGGKRSELIEEWVAERFGAVTRCRYCQTPFDIVDAELWQERPDYLNRACIWSCQRCAHWQAEVVSAGDTGITDYRCVDVFLGKLRTFSKRLPEEVGSEFAQILRRNPSLYHSMTPHELELLVAAVFKANDSEAEVFHVGGTNDGGVDVIYIDNARRQWLIQVKRREHPRRGEGSGEIRNLLGAMVLRNSVRGIFVSTADHFTVEALRAARVARKRGMFVELKDRGKLDRMLSPMLPNRPWLSAISGLVEEKVIRKIEGKFNRLDRAKRKTSPG